MSVHPSNQSPAHLREISHEEWLRMFRRHHYEASNRQVREPAGSFDLAMFSATDFEGQPLGIAIKFEYVNPTKDKVTYCIFGSDEQWSKFDEQFAAQFAGDYS
jgi:hypothetical protein